MNDLIVLEGPDFSGKSTIGRILNEHIPGSYLHSNPGSTPYGQYIRRIVKNHYEFGLPKLDPLIEQMLNATDNYAFTKLVRDTPGFHIADRSNYISGLVYGIASGLYYNDLVKIFTLFEPLKLNKLYIFKISKDTWKQRRATRVNAKADRFDDETDTFHDEVLSLYNIITEGCYREILDIFVDIENVVVVDANKEISEISRFIIDDLADSGLL